MSDFVTPKVCHFSGPPLLPLCPIDLINAILCKLNLQVYAECQSQCLHCTDLPLVAHVGPS